ncbi:hypothetical protein C8F04DRAFT_1187554 [Mycena alexandri]|uniref:Uncharacterized protein n=1 Tax=Mycena alexandri TaxID=1745969 RepID=A0AAD6WW26_9AGAR|nr:hypothetical protein C8F04DRAFT_1187554 [Mycena alexandri]
MPRRGAAGLLGMQRGCLSCLNESRDWEGCSKGGDMRQGDGNMVGGSKPATWRFPGRAGQVAAAGGYRGWRRARGCVAGRGCQPVLCGAAGSKCQRKGGRGAAAEPAAGACGGGHELAQDGVAYRATAGAYDDGMKLRRPVKASSTNLPASAEGGIKGGYKNDFSNFGQKGTLPTLEVVSQ